MKLPIIFDKCPGCGSTERLADRYMKQLKEEGYLPEEYPLGMSFQTPLINQGKMQKSLLGSISGKIKIKVIFESWDTCARCGTLYCTKWDVVDGDATADIQQLPPPQRLTLLDLRKLNILKREHQN